MAAWKLKLNTLIQQTSAIVVWTVAFVCYTNVSLVEWTAIGFIFYTYVNLVVSVSVFIVSTSKHSL